MGEVTKVNEGPSTGYNLLDPIWTFKILSMLVSLGAMTTMIAGLAQLRCFGFWWCLIPFVTTALFTPPLFLSVCQVMAPCLPTTLRHETKASQYYLDAVYIGALATIKGGYGISVILAYKVRTTDVLGKWGGSCFIVAAYLMLYLVFFCMCLGKLTGKQGKRDVESGPGKVDSQK